MKNKYIATSLLVAAVFLDFNSKFLSVVSDFLLIGGAVYVLKDLLFTEDKSDEPKPN